MKLVGALLVSAWNLMETSDTRKPRTGSRRNDGEYSDLYLILTQFEIQ